MGCISLVALGRLLPGCSATGLDVPAPPCALGYAVCEADSGVSYCVDLQSDNLNCGSCGTPCTQDKVCRGGQCVSACGAEETLCPNPLDAGPDATAAYCARTASDNKNCGGCGVQCGAQEVCIEGACASSCIDGQSLCSSDGGAAYCATLSSDNANCGGCGHACGAAQICSSGSCGSQCAAGQSLCAKDGGGPYCASLSSDNANCGGCGHTCGTAQVCSSGSCGSQCAAGQSLCAQDGGGPYCANLSSDNANCGGCGHTCGAPQVCSGGRCASECAVGQYLCVQDGGGPYCADLLTDNGNCGSCGNVCGSGRVCSMGACLSGCPGGQIRCAGDSSAPYCATVQSDNANCGSCGHTCGLQEVCLGGACRSSAACSNQQLVCLQANGATFCIDPLSDNSNCGACGNVCGPVHFCKQGTCQSGCISTQSLCTPAGGAPYCANTQTDNANCGSCELACDPQKVCVAGMCADAGTQAFTVGGNLIGLAYGDSLTLQDNGSDVLVLSGNGPFKFAKPILTGSSYAVTVTNPTSPAVQTCVVTSGAGTMGTASVNTVGVNCTTSTFSLSVTLTGLDPKDSFSTSSNGGTVTFAVGSGGGTLTFPNPVASGSYYYGANGIATGPDYQYCYIPGITVTNANASVQGSCGPVTYSVGGTVTGLASGDTFTIENEGNQYIVNSNGAFTFSQRWASASPYDVIVITDPAYPVAQKCVVASGGSGTVTNANITNVNVTCM